MENENTTGNGTITVSKKLILSISALFLILVALVLTLLIELYTTSRSEEPVSVSEPVTLPVEPEVPSEPQVEEAMPAVDIVETAPESVTEAAVRPEPKPQMPTSPTSRLVLGASNQWVLSSETIDGPTTPVLWVLNQYRVTPLALAKETSQWELIETPAAIEVQLANASSSGKDILSRKNQGKYAIQVMSYAHKDISKAAKLVQTLSQDGHYAYMARSPKPLKGSYWYRVRVGFYRSAEEALQAGQKLYDAYASQKLLPKNFWAAAPAASELNPVLVDRKAQQNQSWMIQTPPYSSEKNVLRSVHTFSKLVDFLYVYQQDNWYMIRMGRFESETTARQQWDQWKKNNPLLKDASLVQQP